MTIFMKTMKKTKSIFFTDEYKENIPVDLMDILSVIEIESENPPDKRTKEYKLWKTELNTLIEKYNKLVNFKCFNLIK